MVEREREGEVGSMLCDRVFDWKTTIRWYVMFMTSLYRWRQETRRYTYAHDPLNKSISLSFCCVDRQEIVRTTQFNRFQLCRARRSTGNDEANDNDGSRDNGCFTRL